MSKTPITPATTTSMPMQNENQIQPPKKEITVLGRLYIWLNKTPEGCFTKAAAWATTSLGLTAGATSSFVFGILFILAGSMASATGFGAAAGIPAIAIGVALIIGTLVAGSLAVGTGIAAIEDFTQGKELLEAAIA